MTRNHVDVLIAGGGFAGLTLAIAVAAGRLGRRSPSRSPIRRLANAHAGDERASAIVAAARRLFETIGVWERVADEAQPILDMVVTDSRLDDAVRPVFLTFAGDVEPGEPFAHMIENRYLVDALAAKAREAGVELRTAAVARSFQPRRVAHNACDIDLADGTATARRAFWSPPTARARRSAAAPASPRMAGITASRPSSSMSRMSAITRAAPRSIFCRRARSRSCRSRAGAPRSCGPRRRAEAERIVALPDDAFHAELEQRFKLHLGEIKVIGARRVHPLGFFVARSFIAERIALVGDAAHVIHPIAGQGLNMGLKDVAALAEVIVDAARLGLDPGAADVLERYQRWRRFDTMAMGLATDGLNRLFSNRSDVLRLARDVGLGLVDRLPNLKRLFIREAAGLVGEVPETAARRIAIVATVCSACWSYGFQSHRGHRRRRLGHARWR